MEQFKQPIIAVILTISILTFGSAGYTLIEGWNMMDSLYMTVITLATVGYGEVHEVSSAGRVFTVFLIILGVGFYLYVAGSFIQFLVEGKLREVLGRRKLDKEINRLEDHYIICGYGRIGRVLCRYLTQKNLDVVVIEKSEDRVPVMNDDNILYIVGEATHEINLIKAGIKRAKGLLTALATDADNVFLVLTAKYHNPSLFIVARAIQNSTKRTLYAAGANKVISPYDVGARRMAHTILRPTVIHFLELAFSDEDTDIQLEEYPVNDASPLIGVSLQDSKIRQDLNLIILSIKRSDGKLLFNPGAESKIKVGDIVIAVGENRSMIKLAKILNP